MTKTKTQKVEVDVPTYSVFYAPNGADEWLELKDVTNDGYIEDLPIRYFITINIERHEICGLHNQFWFKGDRNEAINSAEKALKRSKPRLATG